MKPFARIFMVSALLLLLTACGGPLLPDSTAAPPAGEPAATAAPAPQPTATPKPTPTPAPDPSDTLEYTMLPVTWEGRAFGSYEGETWQFMPRAEAEAARKNGYLLAQGLYEGDAEKVRAALSDRVLAAGNPLEELEGLKIAEIMLAGGLYEIPYMSLTVVDPGVTPLLAGEHTYNLRFDETGKVDFFSPFSVAAADALADGEDWVSLGNWGIQETIQGDTLQGVRYSIQGRLADPLGLRAAEVRGTRVQYHADRQPDGMWGENVEEEETSIPGKWPLPLDLHETYGEPPEGNVLSPEERQQVCDQLNRKFASLRDGTYDNGFGGDPAWQILGAWDNARPLPLTVTPESLRSQRYSERNPDIPSGVSVWVPLPDHCWVVYNIAESGGAAGELSGRSYVLEVP